MSWQFQQIKEGTTSMLGLGCHPGIKGSQLGAFLSCYHLDVRDLPSLRQIIVQENGHLVAKHSYCVTVDSFGTKLISCDSFLFVPYLQAIM